MNLWKRQFELMARMHGFAPRVFKRKRLELLPELAPWAESEFADIWTAFAQIANGAERSTLFLFTGSEHLAGTTTVALASATGLARDAGVPTLLIEAYPGQQRLSTIFQWPDDNGLSDALHDPGKWQSWVRTTPFDKLHILTAGERSGVEPGLLVSGLPKLLELAGAKYRAIIVDLPPLLEHSPFRALLSKGKHAVIVTRHGRSRREALHKTAEIVEGSGTDLLGCVLNAYVPPGPAWMVPSLGGS